MALGFLLVSMLSVRNSLSAPVPFVRLDAVEQAAAES